MAETPENESRRVRSISEMLDSLASDFSEMGDSIDTLKVKAQALLEIARLQQEESKIRKFELAEIAESNRKDEEWRQESDRRFYTLLEEVRSLNRRGDKIDRDS